MKNVFFLIIFGLFVTNINAQKCKAAWIEEDDFTEVKSEYWGYSLTEVSVVKANTVYAPQFFIFKKGEDFKCMFVLSIEGEFKGETLNNKEWFEKGSRFMFKLEEGIQEFEIENTIIKHTAYKTNIRLISSITKEQIKILSNIALERYRVLPFADGEDEKFEYKVSKGKDSKIKKQINCLLSL